MGHISQNSQLPRNCSHLRYETEVITTNTTIESDKKRQKQSHSLHETLDCQEKGIDHHIHLIVDCLITVRALDRNDGLGESGLDFRVHTIHVLHGANITQRCGIREHNANGANGDCEVEAVASRQSLNSET